MADWNGQLIMAKRQSEEVIEKNARRRQIVEQLHMQGPTQPIYPPNRDLAAELGAHETPQGVHRTQDWSG